MQRGTFPKKSVRSPEAVAMSRHWPQSSDRFLSGKARRSAPPAERAERAVFGKVRQDQNSNASALGILAGNEAAGLTNARSSSASCRNEIQ